MHALQKQLIRKGEKNLKGDTKSYFKHFLGMTIVLFSTGLYNSEFLTHTLVKLGLRTSPFWLLYLCVLVFSFFVLSFELNVILKHLTTYI